MLFGCTPTPENGMDIYVFSIGKADCSLLSFDGLNVLIDTGEEDDGDDILQELDRLRAEGMGEAEFQRSRAQLKGSFLLGMEGSGAHMNAIGKRLLLQNKEFTIEDTLSAIECVTINKVNEILEHVLAPRRAVLAAVGRTRGMQGDMKTILDRWMGRR